MLSGVATLLAAAPHAPHAVPTPAAAADTTVATTDNRVAELRPLEVRIRKLHVVRPDLLRFPMQYDIYC